MWKKFLRIIKNIRRINKKPEMQVLPGQLAFFIVLAIVPILTLVTLLISSFHIPVNLFTDFFEKVFSKEIVSAITPVLSGSKLDFQFFAFIIVGYYIASNGALSIINASNFFYKDNKSEPIKRRIKALLMTNIIVLLFLFILLVPVLGNYIIDLLKFIEIDNTVVKVISFVLNISKGPITWFIIFLFIKILYTMAPDKRINSKTVTKGSIFTSLLWVIATYIYSYYISNFARYDLLYSGLSNIVILMLWLYVLAYIFTIGLSINAEYGEYDKEEKE